MNRKLSELEAELNIIYPVLEYETDNICWATTDEGEVELLVNGIDTPIKADKKEITIDRKRFERLGLMTTFIVHPGGTIVLNEITNEVVLQIPEKVYGVHSGGYTTFKVEQEDAHKKSRRCIVYSCKENKVLHDIQIRDYGIVYLGFMSHFWAEPVKNGRKKPKIVIISSGEVRDFQKEVAKEEAFRSYVRRHEEMHPPQLRRNSRCNRHRRFF